MILTHVICDLLFKNAPWNVALIYIFILNLAASARGFFLSAFDGSSIAIESIKINELLINKIAFSLIRLVASSWHTRYFVFF